MDGMNPGDREVLSASRPQGEYEFDATQNQVIDKLAGRMSFVAIFFLIFGGLGVMSLFQFAVGFAAIPNGPETEQFHKMVAPFMAVQGLQIAVLIAVGVWTSTAATSFKKIVRTQGSDVSHLMSALNNLSKTYLIWKVLILICLVCMVLAIIALFAFAGWAVSHSTGHIDIQ
jgi:hypothetical protein